MNTQVQQKQMVDTASEGEREWAHCNSFSALAFGMDVIAGEAQRAAHARDRVAQGLEAAEGMKAQGVGAGGHTCTTMGSRDETSR